MRKYFFAYYEWNGIVYPVAWVEEDGLPIGEHPKPIEGTKKEINEAEFTWPLQVLKKTYPAPIMRDDDPSKVLKS